MSKRKKIIGAVLALSALALIFAPQVFSVRWDGYFTNVLVKGILRPQGQVQPYTVALSPTAGTGFSITETTNGVIFTVDPSNSTIKGDSDLCPSGNSSQGVTVVVTPTTAATGDRIIGIQNASGTTAVVIEMSGGEPIQNASGTTVPGIYDAEGDIVWLRLPTGAAVSAYVIGQYIQ
jgi:hypothetical protein